MSTTTAIVLVIVGALLLVCGTTFAIVLHNVAFFTIKLTSWYDIAIPVVIAVVGAILVGLGARALWKANRNRAAT